MNVIHVDYRIDINTDDNGDEMIGDSSDEDRQHNRLPTILGGKGHDEKLCFITQFGEKNHEKGCKKSSHQKHSWNLKGIF